SPTEHTPGVLAHIVHKTTPNPESHTLSLHDALPILVLAGIPDDDMTTFQAATARRKGLTIKTSRRMGEVYDRAIRLVENGLVEIDRKSTRLNSSHVSSSYAVFCLKKQKLRALRRLRT